MPQTDCSILATNKNQHADEEVVHQTKDAQGTWAFCGHFQLHIFDCCIGLGINHFWVAQAIGVRSEDVLS